MTESPRDHYRDYHEDVERRGGMFREASFEYEKLAIGYSQKGFETLTYLNGGALVALPAALAFFKADIPRASVILTGGAFIIGLFLVVVAQLMAFFTMAKRGEAEALRYTEQAHRVAALTDPARQADAEAAFAESNRKLIRSNRIRFAGLAFFIGSLVAFVFGCSLGAMAVVTAKDRIQTTILKPST